MLCSDVLGVTTPHQPHFTVNDWPTEPHEPPLGIADCYIYDHLSLLHEISIVCYRASYN